MSKTKLTKAESKRFDKKFGIPGAYRAGTLGIKPEDVKQHLADELSRQRNKLTKGGERV